MRCRTSGRSANFTTCWINALPPSSAGCDLPATINWIGRSASSRSFSSRSGSRSIKVSRLYVGTRRANPMVNTPGSNAVAIQPNSASDAPRSSHDRRNRARTSSTSASRSCERIHHMCPGIDLMQPLPRVGLVAASRGRRCRAVRGPAATTAGAAHVGACTPLVIEPIGTSAGSKPGHSSLNMPRLTLPCSSETPLARCASRRPMCAMLNFDGSSSAPNAMMRSSGTPGQQPRSSAPADRALRQRSSELPKYRLTISTGNRSIPAGTGVCVVNTVDERTTVSAVSKSSPASISSRMRSTPRNPAWPSFMWNTSGEARPSTSVNARIARTPPMPARISCLIRCSWSPP